MVEISTLKNANIKLQTELEKSNSELNLRNKNLKEKEIEVKKVENKCENLASSNKTF